MADQTPPKASKKKIKVLRVAAKRDGFRRAGYAFGSESQDIPLADLDKQKLSALKGDPMLLCVETEVEAEDEAEAEAKGDK
jgi:hypothetical protein